jgi:hypothetical protein
LARDAVGLARCGADRLEATLRLQYEGDEWTDQQVERTRRLLLSEVQRGCSTFTVTHRGEVCQQAAADALGDILGQPADGANTATALRRAATERHGCYLTEDAIRKREQPILQLIAHSVYQRLRGHQAEALPTRDSILAVLGPYAETAGESVAVAADLFSKRAALPADEVLVEAVARSLWAVAQFGVLPVYGLQRLEVLGLRDIADEAISYLLDGMIRVPFTAEPDDLNQLSTAIQLGETPTNFYNRLLATPIMRPVIERFVLWIASHDPKVCLFDSNDVMVGYCGPHYYAALCESFVDSQADYASGALESEFRSVLESLPLRERRRREPGAVI